MTDSVAKVNLLGSTINNWIKIGAIVLTIIGGAYLIYYQIQSNTATNALQDLKDKEIEATITREIQLWGERSDKRYKRAMETATELTKKNEKLNTKLHALEIELTFIKGIMSEQNKK